MALPTISFEYPDWVNDSIDWERGYGTDSERMALAIGLARRNVIEQTGGPFGAIIVESESGRLVGVGVNLVVRNHNSVLHGEVVAIMSAQSRLRSYTLQAQGIPAHELFTSCDPCAMCLGAVLWSGVRRLVCGADRDDAIRLSFDEGPVFPQSYEYLAQRGIEVVRGVERAAAVQVLELYRASGGRIYNP